MRVRATLVAMLTVVVLSLNDAQAQRVVGYFDFTTHFDNREYSGMKSAESLTIFGLRARPKLSFEFSENHHMFVGVDGMKAFGATRRQNPNPELLLYYHYGGDNFKAYAGLFQRDRLMGSYSKAMFSDYVVFFDPVLEGALLQYKGERGFLEFGCDWYGMKAEESRERFMMAVAGEFNIGRFYAGFSSTIHHYAGSETVDGVVDNILASPYLGINILRKNLDGFPGHLKLGVGWLQGYHRDRRSEDPTYADGGLVGELSFSWKKFEVRNNLYYGKPQMPFYDRYGTDLYVGETFFNSDGDIYNRLLLKYDIVSKKNFSLRVLSIHHYDGYKWGWQQMASVVVMLNTKKW